MFHVLFIHLLTTPWYLEYQGIICTYVCLVTLHCPRALLVVLHRQHCLSLCWHLCLVPGLFHCAGGERGSSDALTGLSSCGVIEMCMIFFT